MNILWKSWALLLLAIMVLWSACYLENSTRKSAMIIELDVFSGRPNPTWNLSEEQIMELREALQDLPLADKFSQEIGLGYRGFLIFNPDQAAGLAPHIRIYRGIVTMTMTDGQVQSYRDMHDIEQRLFLQASQHGYKSIVDSVLQGAHNP